METRTSPLQTLIALGLLFLAVITLNSFTHYLSRLNALTDQARLLQVEATRLAHTQVAWEAAIATATSEAAVAAWAHENGMAAPGEELVVPLPAGTPFPPAAATSPPPSPQPVWQLWWEVFFGQRP